MAKEKTLITLSHGSGSGPAGRLVREVILKYFRDLILARLEDAAEVLLGRGSVAFTTDSYVVDPIFFPGGDIGRLAVCGTVNDLAMKGARARYISVALIIEEGFAIADLEKILKSAARAAREAGIKIVSGDTKVVPRGKADRIFITTSGIGEIRLPVRRERIRPADEVIVSGTIGDHGIAVLNARLKLGLHSNIKSDTAPLNRLAGRLHSLGRAIRFLRDPTRGGLASVLNEAAEGMAWGVIIDERAVPVRPAVRGACEMLGLDPLYIANEGKFLAVVDRRFSDKTLQLLKNDPRGRNARVIGRIVRQPRGVWLKTAIGGLRPLIMPEAEGLPRIC